MQELTPGDPPVVGDYRLLARLGAGGMGRVYLGRAAGGRLVAVKLVHPGLADEPDFRRRFAREVTAAQRVGGRWTAPVLGADTASPQPWVATGFVPGPTLRDVVDSLHGPLPPSALWPLVWGLSEALRGIHAAGLIHRDLKPSNVMVTLDGPKVIDFGVAKAADASVATRTGSVIGSPGFMAPEQVRADPLTPAADLFGLGAVLVHAATGTAPFSGGGVPAHVVLYRVLHEQPELGAMDGPLRELAARCLARDPAARPTVDEVSRLAAAHADATPASGSWLPGGLAARLGREAARLLELESATPTARPAPPPPPAAPPPAPPAA
ncbi:serine/threonine-protein kinase, partial [Streptomyces sedi]